MFTLKAKKRSTSHNSIVLPLIVIIVVRQQGTSGETNKNGLLGSLGRSVGNKLRLKLTRSNSVRNSAHNKVSQHILCALLHTDKRHEYLDIMIENYLQSAKERFHQTSVSLFLDICSYLQNVAASGSCTL